MTKKKNTGFIIISIIAIIGFAALSFFFPYSLDDWAWGGPLGIERFESWFEAYNGRYLGNLLILLLTRSNVIRIIIMALSFYWACFLCCSYSKSKKLSVLLFALVTFFIMPKDIFIQTVSWASGYSNYFPPILMTVTYFCIIQNIFETKKPYYLKITPVITVLLGFAGALFMENVTIFSVVISVIIIIFAAVKFRKVYITHIAYFIGSAAGAVVMFTNSAYGLIASGEDSYRQTGMSNGSMFDTIKGNFQLIYENLFIDNVVIFAVLSLLSIILFIFASKNLKTRAKVCSLICIAANVLSLAVLIIKKITSINAETAADKPRLLIILFFTAVSGIYFISLAGIILISADKKLREKTALILISVPVVVAPLAVVNPVRARCFLPPYLLFMVLAVILFDYLIRSKKEEKTAAAKGLCALFAVITIGISAFYFSIYIPNYICDKERNEYLIEQSKVTDQVTLPRLPYDEYVYGDAELAMWNYRYKKYLGVDTDIKLDFVDYEEYYSSK